MHEDPPGAALRLEGVCEPSAAIAVPGGFVLAEDDRAGGPVAFARGATRGEALSWTQGGAPVSLDDVEAAAGGEGASWWLTSHAKAKGPRMRLARAEDRGQRLIGCVSLEALRDPAALAAACPGCGVPSGYAGLGAKEGGLDIEGLALHEGALWVGLRGPLTVDGRALALALDVAGVEAALGPCGEATPTLSIAAVLRGAQALDLGGRGVRALAEGPEGLALIAGPVGGGGDFQLFSWRPGEAPRPGRPVPAPAGSSPEALLIEEGEALVFYDEGGRVEDETGRSCEALLREGGGTATLRRLPLGAAR